MLGELKAELKERATKFANQEVPLERTVELTKDIAFIDNYPLDENNEADAKKENTEKAR